MGEEGTRSFFTIDGISVVLIYLIDLSFFLFLFSNTKMVWPRGLYVCVCVCVCVLCVGVGECGGGDFRVAVVIII